jgi:hypothetical protein
VVRFHRHILRLFDIKNALENGQPVSDTGNPHALEVVMQQRNQRLANNFVF